MRFTVEQVFLTDGNGEPAAYPPDYHVVEAESVDDALAHFLDTQSASLVGAVRKYPGFQAVATARSAERVFTLNLLPGSDTFRRHSR